MTNELAEEGGLWRTVNKFMKKIVREKEGDLRGGRLLAKKTVICEEEGDLREEDCSTRTTNELAEEGE
jgi:hypothetical protein